MVTWASRPIGHRDRGASPTSPQCDACSNPFFLRHDITDQIETADSREPTEQKEPMANKEPNEPNEPTDIAEPTDLIDRTEPLEAMERND